MLGERFLQVSAADAGAASTCGGILVPRGTDGRDQVIERAHRDGILEIGSACTAARSPPRFGSSRRAGEAFARAGVALLDTIRQSLNGGGLTSARPNRWRSADKVARSVHGDPRIICYLGDFEPDNDAWLEVAVQSRIKGCWSLHAHDHWLDAVIAASTISAPYLIMTAVQVRIGPGISVQLGKRVDTGDCRDGF
ncbi:hypothetical protein [Mycobacterium malmoense]|uniref:hypothetical protein n=1 Tax=Mycobacterium malmoense TaxID=1780 RepID=UPI001130C7BD|nr:hypothetical protein [Mycobacterium malmoense]